LTRVHLAAVDESHFSTLQDEDVPADASKPQLPYLMPFRIEDRTLDVDRHE
jgi:hypothetical protein